MKPLSRLESLIGEILERPAWLLSSRRLHPLEISAALSRALERRSMRLADRVLAPDSYRVRLHPDDLATFAEATPALERELGAYLAREIEERDLTVNRSPSVSLQPDPQIRPGKIQVSAAFGPVADGAPARAVEATRAIAAAAISAPPSLPTPRTLKRVIAGVPALEALDPAGHVVQLLPLRRLPAVIGRGSDCEVPLLDAKVSRNHARIERTATGYELCDLGSLNGTLLNGRPLTGKLPLVDRDLIQIGRLQLRFAEQGPARG